jgi:hypothetical protein
MAVTGSKAPLRIDERDQADSSIQMPERAGVPIELLLGLDVIADGSTGLVETDLAGAAVDGFSVLIEMMMAVTELEEGK